MIVRSLLLVLGLLRWGVRYAVGVTCPDSSWHRIGEKCYSLSITEHSFEDCQNHVCGPAGAVLACIRLEDSGTLIHTFGVGHRQHQFSAWIGYTDAASEGSWSWVNDNCRSGWTNWLNGDPNNYCGGEDCAALSRHGWLDMSCRVHIPCLCEYPGTVSSTYNRSIAGLRDDTCYSQCEDGYTRWCNAWPFHNLYKENGDTCRWEDEHQRLEHGRGVSECASRVNKEPGCGRYFSYSPGRCRCSPKGGQFANCSYREPEEHSDVFVLTGSAGSTSSWAGGVQIYAPGQFCPRGTSIDEKYFENNFHRGITLRHYLKAAAAWLAIGVPCTLVMFCVLIRMCRPSYILRAAVAVVTGAKQAPAPSGNAAYGPLLDGMDTTAGDTVNSWVFAAAIGAIVYGLALLALGATLAAHLAGNSFAFHLDMLEALLMTASKVAVGGAARIVHYRLSPVAREVVGHWLLVFSAAKFGMALCSLAVVFVFGTLILRDYANICLAAYLFRWSLLLSNLFQCISGVAIWRVQERASRYAGAVAHVGGWTLALVAGNFGSGAGTWWAGYLSVVHEYHFAVAPFFILAAISQLVAGVALLLINRKVKAQFASSADVTHGAENYSESKVPAQGLGYATYDGDELSLY